MDTREKSGYYFSSNQASLLTDSEKVREALTAIGHSQTKSHRGWRILQLQRVSLLTGIGRDKQNGGGDDRKIQTT